MIGWQFYQTYQRQLYLSSIITDWSNLDLLLSDFGEQAIIDRFKQIDKNFNGKIIVIIIKKNRYNCCGSKNFEKYTNNEKIIVIPYEKKEAKLRLI